MANCVKVILGLVMIATLCGNMSAMTPIRACANKKPLPLMVQIDNCSDLPCSLWKGTDSHMAIQFVATKNSMSELRADVRLTTLGANVPFELIEERADVCSNLMFGAYCPLDAGEDVTYQLVMSIAERQPEVPMRLEITLRDRSDDSVVACFVTDARVKRH